MSCSHFGGCIHHGNIPARNPFARIASTSLRTSEKSNTPGDFSTSFTAKRSSVSDPEAFEVYKTYRRSLDSIEHDETSGLKPEFLAQKISKIVAKRNPANSYVVANLEQRLSVFLKTILPSKLFDRILASYYHLKLS